MDLCDGYLPHSLPLSVKNTLERTLGNFISHYSSLCHFSVTNTQIELIQMYSANKLLALVLMDKIDWRKLTTVYLMENITALPKKSKNL